MSSMKHWVSFSIPQQFLCCIGVNASLANILTKVYDVFCNHIIIHRSRLICIQEQARALFQEAGLTR